MMMRMMTMKNKDNEDNMKKTMEESKENKEENIRDYVECHEHFKMHDGTTLTNICCLGHYTGCYKSLCTF